MSSRDATASPTPDALRWLIGLAAIAAVLALAVWLWSRLCDFPAQPWNDIRLAPTLALAQGIPVFPTAEQGTINTWTYGPLPLLWSWPASWASTAEGALMIAGALNLLLVFFPIALVCCWWPAADVGVNSMRARSLAFLASVAVWPALNYSVMSADNLAIACGLLGNLALVRARGAPAYWAAAVLASAAVACKQTAAGIPLAQIIWLGVVAGVRPALTHAARCALAGVVIAAGCVAGFGGAGLRFVLFELPAHFRWAPDPLERLGSVWLELLAQIGAPGLVILMARRTFARREWLLPALAWACALPLGLSALLKFGGRMNSVYSFALWLPAVATLVATTQWPEARRRMLSLGALLVAVVITCARIERSPRFFLRPQVDDYREARRIAERLGGQVWFPFHPLVTLYGDHRYYHDEDGLYVRRMTHRAVTPEHAAAGLPPRFRAVALHEGWTDFGIARALMPDTARRVTIGNWNLWIIEASGAR